MTPTISVCIPVYNFGLFVEQTLASILPQTGSDAEVIVFDGGSTDNTSALMERLCESWPSLRYHRADARGGIDADLARCVELASGEYCWLFSGDDLMRPGALDRAKGVIAGGSDVILCKHTNCTISMEPLNEHPVFQEDHPMEANLSDAEERRRYFRRASTTEAFFSFMGGIIVRRAKWLETGEVVEFRGSCWGHVARLLELSKEGLKVCFVPEVWLEKRGENDSFLERGIVNRYRIAIEGYQKLAERYFGRDSEEAFHVRRTLRNELKFVGFLWAKEQAKADPEREDKQLLDRLVNALYSDPGFGSYAGRFVYHAMPVWLYRVLRGPYRRLRVWWGRRLKGRP